MFSLTRSAAVSLLALGTLVGCGGGSSGPQLVPAKGKVMRGGQPLANVVLQFIPEKGQLSAASTNAQGEFTLYGPGGKEGAIPGTFKVTVACPFNPAAGSSGDGSAPTPNASPCSLPAKYSVPDTTTISVTIPPEGKSDLVVEVPAE